MKEIKNLDDKRVCDQSDDKKKVEIRKRNCLTIITANKDGTLDIKQKYAQ